MYNFPFLGAALRLIHDIKKYNEIKGLKKELAALHLLKYTLSEACSRQGQALISLAELQSHGIIEEQIVSLNTLWKL
jgi:hypothetical protein